MPSSGLTVSVSFAGNESDQRFSPGKEVPGENVKNDSRIIVGLRIS